MSLIPGMLTIEEARARLSIRWGAELAYSTVAGYVSRKLLPCKKQGNMVFLAAADVEKFDKPKAGNPNFVAKKRPKSKRTKAA